MLEMTKGVQSIVETCMQVKPGERVLIIADNEGGPTWVGQLFMDVINSLGAEAVLAVITPLETSGQEPPAAVAAAMKSVDSILCVTDKHSIGHTDARKAATAAGVKYFMIVQVPIDDIKRGVLAADIRLIKERTETLAQRLEQANVVRVTSPFGASITMSVNGRRALPVHPLGLEGAGLPDYGEAAIAPVEGTAEGVIVVDLAVVHWGYPLREPLRCTVKAGKVVDISGSAQEVDRLRKIIATDENASNIAELGLGTSHTLPWAMHGTRRDAGRIGTVHIGIGRNNDIGGNTWSHIHLDGLMSRATVELDGQCVLRENVLSL